MPRPRKEPATDAALRMRKLREKRTAGERLIESAKECRAIVRGDNVPAGEYRPHDSGRLVRQIVYVPKGDEKVIQKTAERLRRAARIPESEVPE